MAWLTPKAVLFPSEPVSYGLFYDNSVRMESNKKGQVAQVGSEQVIMMLLGGWRAYFTIVGSFLWP